VVRAPGRRALSRLPRARRAGTRRVLSKARGPPVGSAARL
jgi:hypothetical protein